ncbi:MAG: CPBP family intramembrane metalloprotease [Candidatus Heimdallarchaeota archaeon]|nr:CPBP family intramembrane metalloprotease [Candidatus Heimdallarchaeota archaeon]MDH5646317.1 CPBP family intramembrane metalloprotease [Candidatus Heimdallarchaeota archaeon]
MRIIPIIGNIILLNVFLFVYDFLLFIMVIVHNLLALIGLNKFQLFSQTVKVRIFLINKTYGLKEVELQSQKLTKYQILMRIFSIIILIGRLLAYFLLFPFLIGYYLYQKLLRQPVSLILWFESFNRESNDIFINLFGLSTAPMPQIPHKLPIFIFITIIISLVVGQLAYSFWNILIPFFGEYYGRILGRLLGTIIAVWIFIEVFPHTLGSPFKDSSTHKSRMQLKGKFSDIVIGVTGSGIFIVILYWSVSYILLPDQKVGYNFKMISMYFSLALISGMIEELAFRGIILERLRDFYSDKRSIAISSIVFSFAHLFNLIISPLVPTLIQVIYSFIAGVALGSLYVKTKSIWSPMIIHYLINSVGFGFTINNRPYDEVLDYFVLEEVGWIFGTLGLLIFVIIYVMNVE